LDTYCAKKARPAVDATTVVPGFVLAAGVWAVEANTDVEATVKVLMIKGGALPVFAAEQAATLRTLLGTLVA